MNVKIEELMSRSVIAVEPHTTVAHARTLLKRNKVGVVPVVDSEGRPVGILSASDLLAEPNGASPVSSIMTEKVYTVPRYDDVSTAARVMRNHRIHHVVVTHEQLVVGVLSAFDLLKLVEGRRFVAKNAPSSSRRKGSRRA